MPMVTDPDRDEPPRVAARLAKRHRELPIPAVQRLMDLGERAGLVVARDLVQIERIFTAAAEAKLPVSVQHVLGFFQLGLTQFYLLVALFTANSRGASLRYLVHATANREPQLQPELVSLEKRGCIRWTAGCAGLTESGRAFAVYAIYRVLTAANAQRGQA